MSVYGKIVCRDTRRLQQKESAETSNRRLLINKRFMSQEASHGLHAPGGKIAQEGSEWSFDWRTFHERVNSC